MQLYRLLALLVWLPASLSARQLRIQTSSVRRRRLHPRVVMMKGAVSKEDAESNARLLKALFTADASDTGGGVDLMPAIFNAVEESQEKDKETSSHLQLDYDEDGNPQQLRFVYVDEIECIGCMYCAQIARNTFFIEDDAGRARAFAQGQDEPEIIIEAIDSCPVNCISFVDLEDLTILESERDGLDGTEGMVMNPRSIGTGHGDNYLKGRMSETKAKLSGGLMCCNNCPSKGCKDCPMYGVGLNPVYQARLEEREAKREASGANQRERDDAEKSAKVDKIYGGGVGVGDGSGRWNQGDFALVSASVWPDYPCEEQGGRGWLVQLEWVAEAGGQTSAKVRFVVDEEYEPQELDVRCLEPVGGDAEECIIESNTAAELLDCLAPDDAERETMLQSLFSEPSLDDDDDYGI
jgi:ferredoxin